MTTQNTILNLNQALQCISKCDCCDKMQQQINSLNQKINNLEGKFIPRSEEPNIINKSVFKAEQLIMPAVGIVIADKISPVAKLAADALALASKVSTALTKLLATLAPILPYIGAIIALLSSAGALKVLGWRIDALERYIDSIANDLSRAYGLIGRVKGIAENAEGLAEKAIQDIIYVQRALDALRIYVNNELKNLAQSLRDEIRFLTERALAAMQRLENLIYQQIAFVQESVRVALGRVWDAISGINGRIDSLSREINQLKGKINLLEQGVVQAIRLAYQALFELYDKVSYGHFEWAVNFIQGVNNLAEKALSKANSAFNKAEEALKKAAIPGPRGLQGIQGKQGIQGIQGKQGIQGIQGKQGERGRDGTNGKDGTFNMAELAGITMALGVMQSKIANIEVVSNNIRLKTDALPSTMQEALCREMTNGKCFPTGLNMWYEASPLANFVKSGSIVGAGAAIAEMRYQIGAMQFQLAATQKTVIATNAAVLSMKPVVVSTGNIINTNNQQITNLGNQINNQTTTITKPLTNINNQVTNLTNPITNINNQINNQTNAITNVNNQITNLTQPITNTSTQVNNITNQVTNLSTQVNNQTNTITNLNNRIEQKIDEITWTSIQVETIVCEKNSQGEWTPNTQEITIKIITTKTGNEADKVRNLYKEIAKANREICLAKNKDEDIYLAVPDMWQIRPEHTRPQAVYQFAEVSSTGAKNPPKYVVTIPHHKDLKPTSAKLPSYKRGNWETIYVLADNSKIILHTSTEAEGQKVLNAALKLIDSSLLNNAYLSKSGKIKIKKPIKEITVQPRMVKFFSEGRKGNKPDWEVRF